MISSRRCPLRFILSALVAALCLFAFTSSAQQAPPQQSANPPSPVLQSSGPQASGSITGTLADRDGDPVVGAQVTLARDDNSPKQNAFSNDDGQYTFTNVAPGPFHLTIVAPPFQTQNFSAILGDGESFAVPRITLTLSGMNTVVRVGPSNAAVAERQIKVQEQQRVLKVIPNFYVTYLPDAVPLTRRQKFELSWKTAVDPISFGLIGLTSGVQQADDDFKGYGQGAEGYGKRYGASYADFAVGTFLGSAILPSLLKQDPRYFYKGTGSKRSRFLYAIGASVICKGDNGRWQPNYSNILGNLAAGGISNLYYPSTDRSGAQLTIEIGLLGVGATAAANVLQEFIVRRFTPNARKHETDSPSTP